MRKKSIGKNKIEHVNIITIKRKRNQWLPDRKKILKYIMREYRHVFMNH